MNMLTKKLVCLALCALFIAGGVLGCKSPNKGSREFIPGKGWTPVD